MLFRKMILAGAAGLALGASQASAAILYEPAHDRYAGSTSYGHRNAVPIAKPLWSAEYGLPKEDEYGDDRIAVGGGRVYYAKNGAVVATDVRTGAVPWTYRGHDVATVAYADGAVYALTTGGGLHKLDAATGRRLWTHQADEAAAGADLYAEAQAVYLATGQGLLSVDAVTGHLNWENPDAVGYLETLIVLEDKLLYPTVVSGALTTEVVYAVDKATGKTLWRAGGVPLQIRDDVGYFQNTWPVHDLSTHGLQVDVVDMETGEVKEKKPFVPIPEGQDRMTFAARQAVMSGDQLLARGADGVVYKHHIDVSPDAANVERMEVGGEWIAGPYDGKLFFHNQNRLGLYARKTIDRTWVYYEGLDNAVQRIDFVDTGMFVGQTDGEIYALNVSTAKALFRFDTGSQRFGRFHVAAGTLLVQGEDKLYAFALPAELTKPLDGRDAQSYPEAKASLSIDGQAETFEPGPVMIDSRLFVPLRALFQAVGATVDFDDASGEVRVAYRGRAFALKQGAPYADVAGERQPMPYAPTLANGSVYVPLREVGALLGVSVAWDDATRTVEIRTAP